MADSRMGGCNGELGGGLGVMAGVMGQRLRCPMLMFADGLGFFDDVLPHGSQHSEQLIFFTLRDFKLIQGRDQISDQRVKVGI